jgi:hypothetical protein
LTENVKKNSFSPRLSSKPCCSQWKGPTQYFQHELALLLITRSTQTHVEISLSARGSNFPSTLHEILLYVPSFFKITKCIHITKVVFGVSVHPRVCFLGGSLQRMLGLARKIWFISVKYISYSIWIHAKIKLHIFYLSRYVCKTYTIKDTQHYPRLHSFHKTFLNVLIILRNSRQDTNCPCGLGCVTGMRGKEKCMRKSEVKDYLVCLNVDWEIILK